MPNGVNYKSDDRRERAEYEGAGHCGLRVEIVLIRRQHRDGIAAAERADQITGDGLEKTAQHASHRLSLDARGTRRR